MRSRLRRQFYCDHCKKSGASRFHMEKHERGCTNNPERVCRMCAEQGSQESRDALIEAADRGVKVLREVAGACPACMLTGVRAWLSVYLIDPTTLKPNGCMDENDPRYAIYVELSEWKYADERKAWWAEVNAADREIYGY